MTFQKKKIFLEMDFFLYSFRTSNLYTFFYLFAVLRVEISVEGSIISGKSYTNNIGS